MRVGFNAARLVVTSWFVQDRQAVLVRADPAWLVDMARFNQDCHIVPLRWDSSLRIVKIDIVVL